MNDKMTFVKKKRKMGVAMYKDEPGVVFSCHHAPITAPSMISRSNYQVEAAVFCTCISKLNTETGHCSTTHTTTCSYSYILYVCSVYWYVKHGRRLNLFFFYVHYRGVVDIYVHGYMFIWSVGKRVALMSAMLTLAKTRDWRPVSALWNKSSSRSLILSLLVAVFFFLSLFLLLDEKWNYNSPFFRACIQVGFLTLCLLIYFIELRTVKAEKD